MIFPFSINSAVDWLDLVPKYLISLEDNEFVQDKGFHQYIGSTLETYFSQSKANFFSAIKSILTTGTEYGKNVLLESLFFARIIWRDISLDYNIQPILTELALSQDRIYAKRAVQLSSHLEDLVAPKREEIVFDEAEEIAFESDDLIEDLLTEETRSKPVMKSPPPPGAALPPPSPAPPDSVTSDAKAAPSRVKDEIPLPSSVSPPESKPAPPPSPAPVVPAPTPTPEPELEPALTTDYFKKEMKDEAPKKRKKAEKKKEKLLPAEIYEEPEKGTLHTHVHYYSRMNPRKTYPFTVSVSRIAKAIKADKTHFLSGEEEKETRGEFEMPDDVTKQLIVEPLIPGCLIQPTFQYFSPQSKNLPKEMIFFVTPLIETGMRATSLSGSLYVKNDLGLVLLKLELPGLAITSHRVSQVLATLGTVAGGAMPALDFMFGGNLQAAAVNQLASYLPALAEEFDMWMLLTGTQIGIFIGAIGLGVLWWWKKSRAKLAPRQDLVLQLPQ
ncbi:MAG: hypothetical protein ACXACU_12210 [Candidatus Hodarchaeales archaeon]|jgi:hypothetical protein